MLTRATQRSLLGFRSRSSGRSSGGGGISMPALFLDLESDLDVTAPEVLPATGGAVTEDPLIDGNYTAGLVVTWKFYMYRTVSGTKEFTAPLTIGPITNLAGKQFNLSWTVTGANADGIRILRDIDGGGFVEFADVPAAISALDDDGEALHFNFHPGGTATWAAGSTVTPVYTRHISPWADQTAYDNDVTQATVAAQPTLIPNSLNGFAIARFDAGDSMGKAVSLAGYAGGAFTLQLVIKLASTADELAILSTTAGALVVYLQSGVLKVYNDTVLASTYAPTTDWVVLQIVFGSGVGASQVLVDGVSYGTGTLTPLLAGLYLNSDHGGTLPVPTGMDLAQVKAWPGALSAEQLAIAHAQAAAKYTT